MIKTNLFIHI